MLATTHYARTNPDGTVTTKSVTFGEGVTTRVNASTHSAENFRLIFGVSKVNDVCICTVMLDDVLLVEETVDQPIAKQHKRFALKR